MGACLWDLSLGQCTGDGRFDGETYLGGLLIFFLGGRGRGRGTPGHNCRGVFTGRREFQTTLFMLYIIYYCAVEVSKFRCSMRQTIANGDPDPRCPGQTRVMFGIRQPVDLVHALKTLKGLLLLVPPRTPRSSGYDVYAHEVYVVICYMSVVCCISVICLVLGGVVRVRFYVIY
jgi:hypothetical protein